MYSRLDSIFKTQFRHAETTDTRQKLRREEKTEERKKRGRKEHQDPHDSLWEDNTTISVGALSVFLQGLVKIEREDSHGHIDPALQNPDDIQKTPKSGQTARAINAYQTTVHATEKQTTSEISQSSSHDIKLTAEERRIIHGLIKNLDVLSKKGMEKLSLKPATSFLESLKISIDDIMAGR